MIIQGGMGIAVSDWRLARAVGMTGQMGVVSGTAIDAVMARRLQLGDPTGELRKAFEAFPLKAMAERVWERYFRPQKPDDKPYASKPLPAVEPGRPLLELTVVSNFVEVWLAKQGHTNPIGINLLEKIQLPTVPSLFGAMLAGVDYVLMGAGIPRQIPGVLDKLSMLQPAEYRFDVHGAAPTEHHASLFDPAQLGDWPMPKLARPFFLAIVSSTVLAQTLVKKCTPPVDGLIIEGPLAGGHNAPPRGSLLLDERQEPIYGPRDEPDLSTIASLGVPFWMAGSYGEAGMLRKALELGATGIQLGTAFAFCDESGVTAELKSQVVGKVKRGEIDVHTDALASPTGFPFKVVQLEGTVSDPAVAAKRERVCDLGYLRTAYQKEDGTVGWRCAAEPVEDFVAKGGDESESEGRRCICNGLFATVGLGQVRKDGRHEPAIVTAGNDLVHIARFIPEGQDHYTAADVVSRLLTPQTAP
jgi:nitronate monooxygenase